MQAFLESYNFAGKRIIPFCTHGGGGTGYIEKTIKRLCTQANVLTIFAGYDSSIKECDLEQWLQKNGLLVGWLFWEKYGKLFTIFAAFLVVYACSYMIYIVSAEEVSAEEYSRMSQQLVEDSLRPVASCENQCNE